MMRTAAILIVLIGVGLGSVLAQTPERSGLDGTRFGVVYDVPATRSVKVTQNVRYSGDLAIDIYSPPAAKSSEKRPAVIFLNAIGDSPESRLKSWGIYSSWPRLIAAEGMIGISMDADGQHIQESLRSLFDFLAASGSKYGIDASRLGVYAASANVSQSAVFLMGPTAPKGIKAAVLYYGSAPEMNPRRDLPILFVIAESDMARLGPSLPALWQRIAETRAPWTLQMATGMPHAFDAFEDTDESRRIVQQTIEFWRSHLQPLPQPPWKPSPERAIVAAIFGNDADKAVPLLKNYLEKHPNDGEAYSQYGRMLAQLRRTDEAATALERAIALGAANGGIYNSLGQIRLSQKRWKDAIDLLTKSITQGNSGSLVYGQIAWAHLNLNENEAALDAYKKSFEVGIPPGANTRGVAYYNMACAYARLKDSDKAFEMLNKAVDEGLAGRARYETDADLAPLKSDPRFAVLLDRMPKTSN